MAVELATAYVALVPTIRGIQGAVAREFAPAQREAQKAGDKAGSGFGDKFKKAVVVGVAAGVTAAVASTVGAINLEAVNDKLSAQLGLSQQESARIGGIAGQLYSDAYGDSMQGVNDAIRGVVQNIDGMRGASSAALEDTAARALDLTTAFDQDLAGATRAIGVIMRTGLADNAEEAFDVLIRGFQSGADGSGDLLDTFTEYPALFQRLGLDAETAMGLINQGLANGARNSDLVADALKEFQIRATDASTLSAEGFQMLGLNAEEMTAKIAAGGAGASEGLDQVLDALRNTEDPVKRNAAAVALFGTQAEDLGASLFALDPSAAVDALGEVAGASDALGETLNDNAKTNLESFKRQAITAFIDVIGGRVLPVVQDLASFLARTFGPAVQVVGSFITGSVVPALKDFATWLQQNQAWLTPIAVGLGAIAVGLLAYNAAVRIATALSKAWAAIQVILNAALRANPIGIVITLLTGLVAGLVYAWKHSETFRNVVLGVWNAVRDGVGAAWNWIKVNVIDRFVAAATTVWQAITTMKDNIVAAWQAISDKVSSAWEGMKSVVQAGVRTVVDIFLGFVEQILSGAETAFGWIPGIGDDLTDAKNDFANFRDDVNESLGGIKDREVTIGVTGRRQTSGTFATGGAVFGPGTATSDSILAHLSNGEHVLTAKEVQAFGGHGAVYKMRRAAIQGDAPAFAAGGAVGFGVRRVGASASDISGLATDFVDSASKEFIEASQKLFNKKFGELPKGKLAFPLPRGSYRVGVGLNGYPGHTGQDFPAPAGTPVYAPFSGLFTGVNLGNRSYGRYANVVAGALRFIGGHLSALIGGNRYVSAGERIGSVGSTGNSTGNHLHAEIRRNGVVQNPRNYFSYDNGGVLQPRTPGINMTRKPEVVFTQPQWDTLETLAARGAGGGDTINITTDSPGYAESIVYALDRGRRRRESVTAGVVG